MKRSAAALTLATLLATGLVAAQPGSSRGGVLLRPAAAGGRLLVCVPYPNCSPTAMQAAQTGAGLLVRCPPATPNVRWAWTATSLSIRCSASP